MPAWRPSCLKPAPSSRRDDSASASIDRRDYKATRRIEETERFKTIVDLYKPAQAPLGIVISGGCDQSPGDLAARVSHIRPGGVAENSDALEAGDYLISVNGVCTQHLEHGEIVQLLRQSGSAAARSATSAAWPCKSSLRLEIEYVPQYVVKADLTRTRTAEFLLSKSQGSFRNIEANGTVDDADSLGILCRVGYYADKRPDFLRSFIVRRIRPGSPADLDATIRPGDRIVGVNGLSVSPLTCTLAELTLMLSTRSGACSVCVDYDVHLTPIDRLQPGLASYVEIQRDLCGVTVGHASSSSESAPTPKPMGLKLAALQDHASGRRLLVIRDVRSGSVAERSGVLHKWDQIVSIGERLASDLDVAMAERLIDNGESSDTWPALSLLIVPAPNSGGVVSSAGSTPLLPPPPAATQPYSYQSSLEAHRAVPVYSALPPAVAGCVRPSMNGHADNTMPQIKKQRATNGMHSPPPTDSYTVTIRRKRSHIDGSVLPFGIRFDGVLHSQPDAREKRVIISHVERGSPAERTRAIHVGDRVLSINGHRVDDLATVDDVDRAVDGSESLTLTLTAAEVTPNGIGNDTGRPPPAESPTPRSRTRDQWTQRDAPPTSIRARSEEPAHRREAIGPGPPRPVPPGVRPQIPPRDRRVTLGPGGTLRPLKTSFILPSDSPDDSSSDEQRRLNQVRQRSSSPHLDIDQRDTVRGITPGAAESLKSTIDVMDVIIGSWHQGDESSTEQMRREGHRAQRELRRQTSLEAANRPQPPPALPPKPSTLQSGRSAAAASSGPALTLDDLLEELTCIRPSIRPSASTRSFERSSPAGSSRQSSPARPAEISAVRSESQRSLAPSEHSSCNAAGDLSAQSVNTRSPSPGHRGMHDPSLQRIDETRVVHLEKDSIFDDFGLSISDGLHDSGVYVARIRRGGPADLAGLLPLDRIVRVNDRDIDGVDSGIAVPLIAASPYNQVQLLIRRRRHSHRGFDKESAML